MLKRSTACLALLLLLPAFAGATPQNPQGTQLLLELAWREITAVPAGPEAAAALATRLGTAAQLAKVFSVDDDRFPDLIAVPRDVPENPYLHGPVIIFRGADLGAGRIHPHVLPSGGDFKAIERVADVNGDGRTEVIVTHQGHGTGQIVTWLFFQWDGAGFRRIFDVAEDNWRGDNTVTIKPGSVTVTCRPMGHFDHKHLRHRRHVEVWVWRQGAYQLTQHVSPPPETDRQGVSDAEAHFYRQEYDKALPLYRQALTLPKEPEGMDFRPFIHLRLGQTLALLGRPAQAAREYEIAGRTPGYVGEAAAIFRSHALAAAFGKVLPWPPDPSLQNLGYTLTGPALAPPAVMLQAFFAAGGDWRQLAAAGIPVQGAEAADLNGDGDVEVLVRLTTGGHYLAVQTQEGWRVGEVASDSRERFTLLRGGSILYLSPVPVGPPVTYEQPLLRPLVEPCRQPIPDTHLYHYSQ